MWAFGVGNLTSSIRKQTCMMDFAKSNDSCLGCLVSQQNFPGSYNMNARTFCPSDISKGCVRADGFRCFREQNLFSSQIDFSIHFIPLRSLHTYVL